MKHMYTFILIYGTESVQQPLTGMESVVQLCANTQWITDCDNGIHGKKNEKVTGANQTIYPYAADLWHIQYVI